VDPKQLNQTLTRWTELGLFKQDDTDISLAAPYRAMLGKSADDAEARLPKVLRRILLSPANNERFWDAVENKSADLSRGLSWIMAQDIYTLETGSAVAIAKLETEQLKDQDKRIFQNDTRWNGLRTWMVYLGFARSGARVSVDPTEALRDTLPEIFGDQSSLSGREFVERVAEELPVLDNGSFRRRIEDVLDAAHWAAPRSGHASTALSRAVQRLDREGLIAAEQRSDAEDGVVLVGMGSRAWRSVTNIRRSAGGAARA
jgi:uncharacterized protein (DUF2267 family)